MPSTKRPGDESEGGAAKKRLSNVARTGQACDRCKIRKIRCDARVGGCSPCLQNNTECKTTDRITGRANSRGHTEKIETENTTLRLYVVELQQQLRDQGVDPKPAPVAPAEYPPTQQLWSSSSEKEQREKAWGSIDAERSPTVSNQNSEPTSGSNAALPGFRPGLIGDNYLGFCFANTWLSPIEGTALTLFGMKIDLADFIPPDDNPDLSATSYQTLLKHAFSHQKQLYAPPLPTYENCKTYAQWYFRSVQQYLPILHRPDFMELLRKIHMENYLPDAPETVMVHMMLSLIMFQYSSRNGNEHTRLESMQHYHYSLSFVQDLIKGHQLKDVQALTMICQLLRCQPRVGGAWMFINMVFGLAIELGLHRSAKAWPEPPGGHDPQALEMRKRIFWSLIVLHTSVGGKLGRPMPLRVEDFDIEIPQLLDDSLPNEAHLSDWLKCSFRGGIYMCQLTRIQMQVWSTVYSINARSDPYESCLGHLEKELQVFNAQLPAEYAGGPHTRDEDRITALYLGLLEHEIRLLMHHPSLSRSLPPQTSAHSYDICLNSANSMLQTAKQLKQLKALDTTWYYAADFLAAIFTTLFVHTERKDQITSTSLAQMRADMDAWLVVMTEVGNLLGTGPRLANAIRSVIEQSLNAMGGHLAAKTASAAVASTMSASSPPEKAIPQPQHKQQQPEQPSQQQPYTDTNGYNHACRTNDSERGMNGQAPTYQIPPTGEQAHPSQAYTQPTQYSYSHPQESSLSHYATVTGPTFDTTYSAQEDIKPSLDSQLSAHAPQVLPSPHQHPNATDYLAAYHSPAPAQTGFAPPPMSAHSQPLAWRNFTDTMMHTFGASGGGAAGAGGGGAGGGQDYLHSPTPLMGMPTHNKQVHGSLDMQVLAASMNQGNLSALQLGDGQHPWPLINYLADSNGGNGP